MRPCGRNKQWLSCRDCTRAALQIGRRVAIERALGRDRLTAPRAGGGAGTLRVGPTFGWAAGHHAHRADRRGRRPLPTGHWAGRRGRRPLPTGHWAGRRGRRPLPTGHWAGRRGRRPLPTGHWAGRRGRRPLPTGHWAGRRGRRPLPTGSLGAALQGCRCRTPRAEGGAGTLRAGPRWGVFARRAEVGCLRAQRRRGVAGPDAREGRNLLRPNGARTRRSASLPRLDATRRGRRGYIARRADVCGGPGAMNCVPPVFVSRTQ